MSAGTTIGNVEITAITNVERDKSVRWEEIDMIGKDTNVLFKGESYIEEITIDVSLVEQLHPQNKSAEEQKLEVESLKENDIEENYINYRGIDGYIAVENVDIPEESSMSMLRQGSISGYFKESV